MQAIFQPWKLSSDQKQELGLVGKIWVEQPLKRIEFHLGRGGGGGGNGARGRGGSGGGGGGARGGGRPGPGRGGHGGGGGGGGGNRIRSDKLRGPMRRERKDVKSGGGGGGVDEE